MGRSMRDVGEEVREALLEAGERFSRTLKNQMERQRKKLDEIREGTRSTDSDLGRDLPDPTTRPHRPDPGQMNGPVVFYDPRAGATPAQQAQIQAYIQGSNEALRDGYLSPTGRVSTSGQLRDDASAAAALERTRNTYNGHAGHVPDTTWTGQADPHSWMDLDGEINSSLGGQSRRYPIGYSPTEFIYGGPHPS